MPDDSRLNRQFEQFYAEQRASLGEDAVAASAELNRIAEKFFSALDAAADRHPDFEEGFRSAAETMRNAWHDVRGDLSFATRRNAN